MAIFLPSDVLFYESASFTLPLEVSLLKSRYDV